jgi:AraC-like DNA-binding protein
MSDAPKTKNRISLPSGMMRFIDWSSLQFHLIWIYEGPVLPFARKGEFTHNGVTCWLVRKGHVEVAAGRQSVPARPGQWVFVAAPTRKQSFSADAEILSIYFHLAWPGNAPLFERGKIEVFPASQFPNLEASAMRLLQFVRRHVDKVDANLQFEKCSFEIFLRTQELLPAWLRAYVECMLARGHAPLRITGMDERATQLVIALDRQPVSDPFDLDGFARRMGLSMRHLANLFCKEYGATPKFYLEKRRRDAARHALAHTSASVKSVAFTLGFRYESHFCAWFRRFEKCTPSVFRKRGMIDA